MPEGKHLHGVGKKEQRQNEHILESAQESGRYGKRAKEVAARTVKQHKRKGHRKGQQAKRILERRGSFPPAPVPAQ